MPIETAPWLAHWPIWLAVTLGLGGPAAFASGRAVALGWRGITIGLIYAVFLSAAASFLAYALFRVPVIPGSAIMARLAQGDVPTAGLLCTGWLTTFAILSCVTVVGWRLTRNTQMLRQYPFLEADQKP